MERQSLTDTLTGLGNRRYGESVLRKERARVLRGDAPCSIALVDVDRFKQVNDTYGHEVGDSVLKYIADSILMSVRPTDFVFRWGGEEFLLVLPGSDISGGTIVAERIRSHIEQTPPPKIESATISGGVAELTANSSIDESLKQADTALLRSEGERKESHRHCVELALLLRLYSREVGLIHRGR